MSDLVPSVHNPARLIRPVAAVQAFGTCATNVSVDKKPPSKKRLNKLRSKRKSQYNTQHTYETPEEQAFEFYEKAVDHPKSRLHRKRFPKMIRADQRRTYATPPVQRLLTRKQAEAAKTKLMKAARTLDRDDKQTWRRNVPVQRSRA